MQYVLLKTLPKYKNNKFSPLPNETWLEVFRFLPLSSLGLCVALCSTRFQQITDMRILVGSHKYCLNLPILGF